MGNILGIYFENYEITPAMKLDISLGGKIVTCGEECDPKRGEQPDERCCRRAVKQYNHELSNCAAIAAAAAIACTAAGPGLPACIAAVITAEMACIAYVRGNAFAAIIACCMDAEDGDGTGGSPEVGTGG